MTCKIFLDNHHGGRLSCGHDETRDDEVPTAYLPLHLGSKGEDTEEVSSLPELSGYKAKEVK